jgi:hypothetical protein
MADAQVYEPASPPPELEAEIVAPEDDWLPADGPARQLRNPSLRSITNFTL